MKSKTEQNNALLKSQEYFKMGVAKSNEKNYREALVNFNKATNIVPKYAIPYYNGAFIKMKLKDYNAAILDFTDFIELNPLNVVYYFYINAYHNRGRAKQFLKDHEGAIADYSKAIQLKSSFSMAYYNRGICKIALEYNGGYQDIVKAKRLGYKK
jgi:tetratricopeptide (TPR) repeat protein